MTNTTKSLQQSALVMKIAGWAFTVGLGLAFLVYPPGFLWGMQPEGFPSIGPPHPPSPYHGLHPYAYMVAVMFFAWGILMIQGAKDPKANAALFNYGIVAFALHGLLMIPQAFIYPNEHAHLWADIPILFIMCIVLWIYHPNRVAPEMSRRS